MLKIVHRICCGIDIHKKFVVATIGKTNKQGVTDYETRDFLTFTENLTQLRDWLAKNNCKEVCMESTGKYWIPVFNILEDTCRVFVANPKYVRGIRGKKTDKRDSLWLCDLHKHGLVQNSFIPPLRIRQIRDLMRYRYKLTNFKSSEKNRAQNSLTVSNIMLSSVVSDTFGKSSMQIVRHLLDNPSDTNFDVSAMMHGNMKASAEEITKSLQGTLTKPQAEKIGVCLNHMSEIDAHKQIIESAVLELAEPYMEQVELLLTVPGIKDVYTAIGIIGEIGADMSVFLSARHLCSWAGVVPANNESAGKKKSVRCARAGTYIKPLLVQCAHAAVKSKECPYFRVRYEQISRRRGKKKAIVAVARMLLNCIYHMISRGEAFNCDLYRIENAPGLKVLKKTEISKEEAIALLESLGAQVILPEAA